MCNLQGPWHGLHQPLFLEQGARLVVVPDGVFDGKDGQRLIPCLHAIAIGCLGLSRGPRVIRQLGGGDSFCLQQR